MMCIRTIHLLLLMAFVFYGLLSCGDDPPPPIPTAMRSPVAPPPSVPAPLPNPVGVAPGQASPLTPNKGIIELTEKDFTEGPTNRDPFRSFLAEFTQPMRRAMKQQRRVILQRYALDELKLIAIVAGGERPWAMFRDPTGLGVTIKRGDYISKNAGRVKQILSDKVIVEIEEQSEDKSSLVDRVIDLHTKEEQEMEDNQ